MKLQLSAIVIPFRMDARANANRRTHDLAYQPGIGQLIHGADGLADIENRLFNGLSGMQCHPQSDRAMMQYNGILKTGSELLSL
ncbi:MAG: hypothetical protein AABP62_27405 [Planctomycetota bacterium]